MSHVYLVYPEIFDHVQRGYLVQGEIIKKQKRKYDFVTHEKK